LSCRFLSTELELHVRATKRVREEITREIPKMAENRSSISTSGAVARGGHVKAGDILSEDHPKGETALSRQEQCSRRSRGKGEKDSRIHRW